MYKFVSLFVHTLFGILTFVFLRLLGLIRNLLIVLVYSFFLSRFVKLWVCYNSRLQEYHIRDLVVV